MCIVYKSKHPEYQLDNTFLLDKWLKGIIHNKRKKLGKIEYTFVTDSKILEINSKYLNHNYSTDIITFDNSFLNTISGEVYISIDTVRDNSHYHAGGDFLLELHRVIAHGVLHLIGYSDSSSEEKVEMQNQENLALDSLREMNLLE